MVYKLRSYNAIQHAVFTVESLYDITELKLGLFELKESFVVSTVCSEDELLFGCRG